LTFFPQSNLGAIAQYPLQRTRQWRFISNQLESGELIMMPDVSASEIGWKLKYSDLSSAEVARISSLFTASQGQYGSFLLVDPMANLLAWSEDLSRPDWQLGQLTQQPGLADPTGTRRASLLVNSAAAEQTLNQTIGIPGDYLTCFSMWLRCDSVTNAGILRDGARVNVAVGPTWTRFQLTASGNAGAAQSTFSIAVGPGQSVQVFGLQVEAQRSAASYKPTTTAAGIYPETYFAADELPIVSTGPGLFALEVDLISRVQA
jgi:hypothetical protein